MKLYLYPISYVENYNSLTHAISHSAKIFEYAALGKPLLAGVSGYAAEFIQTEISNAAVFEPCDMQQALAAFASLQVENTDRREFIAKYARTPIMSAMAQDILSVMAKHSHC